MDLSRGPGLPERGSLCPAPSGGAEEDSGPLLPYSVWQCGRYEELSERFCLLTFDMNQKPSSASANHPVALRAEGICDAVVLWMDWQLSPDPDKWRLSMGPAPKGADPVLCKQGVKLLPRPLGSTSDTGLAGGSGGRPRKLNIKATYSAATGDLSIDVS